MPRDNNKDNGPRGRRDRPAGGKGAGKAAGKGRSGAARGPEKKFAKRGFGATERGEEGRGFAKKAFDKKPFAKRDYDDKASAGPRSFKRDDSRHEGARKPRFDRDERPARGGDRAERGPRKEFGDKRPYAPRGERSEGRPAGRFGDKMFGDKKPFTPRGEGFRKDGERAERPRRERSFDDRPREERNFGDRKPWADRGGENRGPRKDFGRKPRDEANLEAKPWQKRDRIASSHDDRKPRGRAGEGRKFERDGDDRGGERPKFSRPREERSGFDRPRQDRWQEHPRSERGERTERPERSRRDDRPRFEDRPARGERRSEDRPRRDNEDDSKVFAKRPAFGGRGAYRERAHHEERRPPRPAPAKKAGERVAKLIARAGLCSRRDAELWVTEGRVAVNGRVINSPALDVTERDVVTVDGKPLPEPERTRLFLYHKPRGLMTTHADPEGRPTVFDHLPEGLPRLISIGRLDFNTEGLLLLTNDGGLARTLELPDTGWLRRYRVRAFGDITQAQLDALKDGVEVDGVKYGPIDATLERDQGANVWLVFAIREGKNREVRNVLAHLGLEVNRLIRISYGPFQLGEIEEGQVDEVKTRVLREQLGDKIAQAAGANFARQLPSKGDTELDPVIVKKPVLKRSTVQDRKGRRVLVQRAGSDEARERNELEASGYGPPKRLKRGYKGKRDIAPREE